MPAGEERKPQLDSPYLSEELYAAEEEAEWRPRLPLLEALTPFARAFEPGGGSEAWTGGRAEGLALEEETEEGLRKKLTRLSLLPHFVEVHGADIALTPAQMDPGIYDGQEKYLVATDLQKCLNAAMDTPKFRHIKAALVDLTKDVNKPEFAGFNHKTQVFIASVGKIAAMLAAFQLRHDLRAALAKKGSTTLKDLYASVRDDWAATQTVPRTRPTEFTKGIALLGKVVLAGGSEVALGATLPKSPRLEAMFAAASPPAIEFTSTGQDHDHLDSLITEYNNRSHEVDDLTEKARSRDSRVSDPARTALAKAREDLAKAASDIESLGTLERLRVAMGGLVPASNLAISTIVRDVGYPYIASTLLQSGLYDTNRNGGLWLGADYFSTAWTGAPGGGVAQSGTAGSLAAMMTLMVQGRLVDPASSADMRALVKKEPNPTHPGIASWFKRGLEQLADGGSIVQVLSKLGAADHGVDDWTFIERKVDHDHTTLRYVAVGLRAGSSAELKDLILEFDKCILANNGLAPAAGGHGDQHEAELQSADENRQSAEAEADRAWASQAGEPSGEEEASAEMEAPAEESETPFRTDHLPARAQAQFAKGASAWRDAVTEAIRGGIADAGALADLIFFMQHPERMKASAGTAIGRGEADFFKLRAEWNLYHTIATGILAPAGSQPACSVFVAANPAGNYEEYVAAPTTGRVTLMVNGRNLSLPASVRDETGAFDGMQETVVSLGKGDSIFLANWQFIPTAVPLTRPGPPGISNWGELFKAKAAEGVRIRMIIADLPPKASAFQTDLKPVNSLIAGLPDAALDNWKYVFSPHPATMALVGLVGAHHQKFMVVRKGKSAIAYCGGLDISRNRTPAGWSPNFVWHDIEAKLEGLIAHDLEREFVLRWNREKDKSSASALKGWKPLEELVPAPVEAPDQDPRVNPHKIQMLRTVSVGMEPKDIRRDDIWQGYFALIGCARSFLYMENQYFHEPVMADAIVKQAQAQPELIVLIVVSGETDDPDSVYTQHMHSLRHEFFTRLCKGIPANRRRVYTMTHRLVHSKFAMIDDRAMTVGSANANPRGFFLDTELNIMLDDPATVHNFRHRLWAHDLGISAATVAGWKVADFISSWDAVAKANAGKTPDKMAGEGVVIYDINKDPGKRNPLIPDVLAEVEES